MCSSGDSRRAEADATRCPAFTLGGAEAALFVCKGVRRHRHRRGGRGLVLTGGVGGDAFEPLLVS